MALKARVNTERGLKMMKNRMNLTMFEEGGAGGQGASGGQSSSGGSGGHQTLVQHTVLNRQKRLPVPEQQKRNEQHLPISLEARA